MKKAKLAIILGALLQFGCNIQDVPPAHVGWTFEKSKYTSSKGFTGPLLKPGSHDLEMNDALRLIQCTEATTSETFQSPTKNGVEFSVDIYTSFKADCDNPTVVQWTFQNVQPNPLAIEWSRQQQKTDDKKSGEASSEGEDTGLEGEDYYKTTVTAAQLFHMYLRPAIGNAVRLAFSKRSSDVVNDQREQIGIEIEKSIRDMIEKRNKNPKQPFLVILSDINVSKIGFPASMKELNEKLANKNTEKLIEQQEKLKVDEQIATEKARKDLAEAKAKTVESDIAVKARALRENPDYFKYKELELRELELNKAPEVAKGLGSGGGTIVFGSEGMGVLLSPKGK